MPYQKGQSGNRRGRPRGAVNKATRAIKDLSGGLLGDAQYQASLKKRLIAGKAPHMEVLLHHYAHGKPKETVRVEEQPAELRVTILRNRADIQALMGAPDVDALTDDDVE